MAELLLEEYKEQQKLTKRERAFCEYAETGYIVRDSFGWLFWTKNMPEKDEDEWIPQNNKFHRLDIEIFKFITFKDEEPYSVEEMLKWEVEE